MREDLIAFCLIFGVLFGSVAWIDSLPADAQQTSGVTNIAQVPYHGHGSLSISATTSTLLSTLTAHPTATPWPAVPSQVFVINQTSGTCYLCPGGGTCAASGTNQGLWILSGNAYGIFQMATNATAYCASSGTVQAQW